MRTDKCWKMLMTAIIRSALLDIKSGYLADEAIVFIHGAYCLEYCLALQIDHRTVLDRADELYLEYQRKTGKHEVIRRKQNKSPWPKNRHDLQSSTVGWKPVAIPIVNLTIQKARIYLQAYGMGGYELPEMLQLEEGNA